MKKSSKIKLLVLALLIAIVSFAFACTTTPDDGSGSGSGNGGNSEVTLDNYVNNSWEKVPQRYGEILLDGVIDDAAWEKQNKITGENLTIGTGTYNVESSAYFADRNRPT